ncbi:MAG: outer membrane lipoprotein carrier protein LolA [Brumimicrobium sp.]
MSKLLIFLFVVSHVYSFSQEVELSATESAAFKSRVIKETKNLKSIRTDFVQYKHMEFLANDIESTGKMYLDADGKLKWQYLKPNNYSIIFKNNQILINDDGDKSTVDGDQKMFKKISMLISGSVSGNLFDDEEFTISYFKSEGNILVKLSPINKTLKKYIGEVILKFPEQEETVSEVKLIEPSGDYTLIKFQNKQLNATIDKKVFDH